LGVSKSKQFEFEAVLTNGTVMVEINHELDKYLCDGWSTNEPQYFNAYMKWPVRFSVTCKSARENDSRLKILKWPAYHEELVKLFGYEWEGRGMEFAHGWVSNARKNFAYDDWTKSYVSEHEEAHPARGISWDRS